MIILPMTRLPYLLILSIFLLPGLLQAAQNDEEEIKIYDIEIIVYKNLKVPKNVEYVLPISLPDKEDILFDVSSPASVELGAEMSFELVPENEFRLADTVLKINKSSRYELLTHLVWRQPGLERSKAIPVWLKGGRVFGPEFISIDNEITVNTPEATVDTSLETESQEDLSSIEESGTQFPSATSFALDPEEDELSVGETKNTQPDDNSSLYELEGKITVALSRYLHVHSDLILRRPQVEAGSSTSASSLASTRVLNNHNLKEHRRMRSKELHFLDNPEFAMLILITPYVKPETDVSLENEVSEVSSTASDTSVTN